MRTKEILLKLARHGLTTVGGALYGMGYLPEEAQAGYEEAAGALMVLVGFGLSLWELRR